MYGVPSLGIREASGGLADPEGPPEPACSSHTKDQVYAHRELDAAARREVAHDLLAAADELDELTARP